MEKSIKDNSYVNRIMFQPPRLTKVYNRLEKALFWLPVEKFYVCGLIMSFNKQTQEVEFLRENDAIKSKPTIIFCHGNGTDINQMLETCYDIIKECQCSMILLEYPGYGLSSGTPTQSSCCATIEAIIDHLILKESIPANEIIMCGQSIGTGVVTHGAKYCVKRYEQDVGGLILISPFTSIKTLAKELHACGSFVLDRFNNASNLKCCRTPTLLIHGQSDKLISWAHSKVLAKLVKTESLMTNYPKYATHNEFNWKTDIIKPIDSFIKTYTNVGHKPYPNLFKYEKPKVEYKNRRSSSMRNVLATSAELSSGSFQESAKICSIL